MSGRIWSSVIRTDLENQKLQVTVSIPGSEALLLPHTAPLPCLPSLGWELWHSIYWLFSEASGEIWSSFQGKSVFFRSTGQNLRHWHIGQVPCSSLECILPRVNVQKSRLPSPCRHQLAYKGCQRHKSPLATPKPRQEDTFRFPLAHSQVVW